MPEEYVEFDDEYPEQFLECRVHHTWRLIGYYHADGMIVRVEHCIGCRMDKRMRWSQGGTRYRTTYDRPEGYGVKGGLQPWEVRSALLKRAIVFDSAEDLNEALGKSRRRRR